MGCVSFRSAIGSLRTPLYGGWLSVDLRVYKRCEGVRAEDPKSKEGGFSSDTDLITHVPRDTRLAMWGHLTGTPIVRILLKQGSWR